jgi:hypothetical protein
MAATAEATAEEVPNVELVVETATSCDRSRLCMRLPDRHLAYKGACILSAGQAQAGAIIVHMMRIVLDCCVGSYELTSACTRLSALSASWCDIVYLLQESLLARSSCVVRLASGSILSTLRTSRLTSINLS